MKKDIKRILAGCLAVISAISILTACSSKTGPTPIEDDGRNNSSPATAGIAAPTKERQDYSAADNEQYEADVNYAMPQEKGGYTTTIAAANPSIAEAGVDYCAPWYPEQPSGETYSQFDENGYVSASKNPLSTFSADVDTASYTNIRRMINQGYVNPDAVRIEEMINYFSYDYPEPNGNEPFSVTTEMSDCPWNDNAKVLLVGLKAEEIDTSDIGRQNIVFLIDVSGSMADADKLPLVQKAFLMLTENLTENDRISIVTYAGSDAVVLEGVCGNETERISEAIEELMAGGSTAGSAGIKTAYRIAEENFIEGGNNRIILATDGDLNVGITDNDELEELISEKKKSGVFLSVFGFGTGNIKDDKMELLADKGNGSYHYIDSTLEAKRVLVEEMGGTLVTVAKDVKLQVEFNPDAVKAYRLIGYENRALADEDFDNDAKDAGEIGAGHTVTVLYEIIPQSNDDEVFAADKVANLAVRYKEPDENDSKLLEYLISSKNYSRKPSENLKFAVCVAEFGMLLKGSQYSGTASYSGIISTLNGLRCVKTDTYKEEFLGLVKTADEYMY